MKIDFFRLQEIMATRIANKLKLRSVAFDMTEVLQSLYKMEVGTQDYSLGYYQAYLDFNESLALERKNIQELTGA